MERMSFVKNGVLRLPPGFRFHPTDEELVLQYLKRKVHSIPLPAAIIPDVDVCKSDPWDLPGEVQIERYYFSTREAKYPNGNRSNRATVSGYWKATGKDKPIAASGAVVGMKKTLVFYRGKPPHGSRTDWIMHEYRLVDTKNSPMKTGEATGDWVLCRIFKKRRGSNNAAGTRNDQDEEEQGGIVSQEFNVFNNVNNLVNTSINRIEKPVFFDFLARDRAVATDLNLPPPAPSSSSSDSSAVTESSSGTDPNINQNNNNNDDDEKRAGNESSDEQSSSCCNSFSSLRPKPLV